VRNALGPKDLVDRGAESTIELQRTHCWRPGFFIFIHIPVYAHLKFSQIEYCTHIYIYTFHVISKSKQPQNESPLNQVLILAMEHHLLHNPADRIARKTLERLERELG
jgi:hypothetical protein